MRTTVAVLVGAIVVTGSLTACSGGSTSSGGPTTTSSSPAGWGAQTPAPLASAAFAAPAASGAQPTAITYNSELLPAGAKVTVASRAKGGQTQVNLTVAGLQANRMYGAHVHTKQCGAKPADSGPHYQNNPDPVQPSVDPAFANASNEVWLDFTTDAKGEATASATMTWNFRTGQANAVVIHAAHTSTEQGKAGTAGDRLACVTAAF
jgi:superoxide dismutase, Cu-Zn family